MEKTVERAQGMVHDMLAAGLKMKDVVAGTGVNPTTLGWIRKGRAPKITEKTFDRIWDFWSEQPSRKDSADAEPVEKRVTDTPAPDTRTTDERTSQESKLPDDDKQVGQRKLEEARAIVHDLLDRGMTTTDVAHMSGITTRSVRELRESLTDDVSDSVYRKLHSYFNERTGREFVLGVRKDKAGKHAHDISKDTREAIKSSMNRKKLKLGRKPTGRKQWSAAVPEEAPTKVTTNLETGKLEKTLANAQQMIRDLTRAGFSGAQIAREAGMSYPTVARIRNGTSTEVRTRSFERIRDYWLKNVERSDDTSTDDTSTGDTSKGTSGKTTETRSKTTSGFISHDHVPVNAEAMAAVIDRLIGSFEAAVKELEGIRKEIG